ncbi:MAG: winged helix DNA-binding domain-containing protein [Actinomycetota bacterium]|nr:winged helix DNA-binding domain-containing protein [Actinomycetota bacterium]
MQTYDSTDLTRAIEHDRTLVKTVAYIRSPHDLPAVIAKVRDAEMHPFTATWLEKHEPFRRDLLALLEKEGPLLSRDIPDTSVTPWPSSGRTNDRNVTRMLEALALRGHVAISGRKGRQRCSELPERVYPAYIDVPFEGRTALLSPFDRLIHDRVRAEQLFEFEYILEMYKPRDKRRWGYFALPVLHADRLVGKLDATADRKVSALVVNAIHEDVRFTRTMTAAIRAEIEDLAAWLGLQVTGT